jgi:hypothetical protein
LDKVVEILLLLLDRFLQRLKILGDKIHLPFIMRSRFRCRLSNMDQTKVGVNIAMG